ncbi:winged helix-turn-helix transcriptional regulator [Bradyrhizobium australafricanum]|uniref:winged helix-turn-helix transcriptional regulator n=1 Tax=Bradyrhizobium australafricanum TaxID=2821406 RepID=UPI001CE286BA|nr:helix-turn-helix domain-containing protein [Bradyrhizobium australafricanum]MCA6100547.1 helix-turn-helix transcriptional regulator [Bradyrhizobium australafricanum]
MNLNPIREELDFPVALGTDYETQDCPVARVLELLGERWTFLIVRDCFTGISRFGDFIDHLGLPKGVLTVRLEKLVAAGILRKKKCGPRQYDYLLTERGVTLWPILFSMAAWGDTHLTSTGGRRRLFLHAACGTELSSEGACPRCKITVVPSDVIISNGPGAELDLREDPVTRALDVPHRMLTPLAVGGRIVSHKGTSEERSRQGKRPTRYGR